MRLLLKQDVESLGVVGDVVEVSGGYARNCLIPQDIAILPTKSNIKALEEAKRLAAEARLKKRHALEAEADRLRNAEVTISAAANEEGHLYGSVGPKEIAAAMRDEGYAVEAGMVLLPETIRQIDNLVVPIRFAPDLEGEVKVWVVREKESGDLDEGDRPEGEEGDTAPGASEPADGRDDGDTSAPGD